MGAVRFSTQQGIKDEDLRYVKAADLDFNGLSYIDVYGLKQVIVNITSATATQTVFTAALDQNVALSGLGTSDIEVSNLTTPGVITLSGLTESAITPGAYTAAYASGIAVGETIQVKITKSKLSYSTDTFVVTA